MGWVDRLRRWLREKPPKSTAPVHRRTAQDDDEEIAELLAIDII